MSEDDFLASITVRISYNMLKDLKTKYGKGKKYRDRSDAIRSVIGLGLKVDSMLQIMSDPKKKKEFEEKFAFLLKEKDIRKSLEPMEADQLSAISFFIEELKNKKVQLLIDEVK